ncbi:hypothetical protein SAMN04490220_0033 [Rhodococcus jostii]|uniref:Uncharacterized protein n=1 Tax=Rhodococcus jostii TaxID=132919 RepID=A0A1H4II56_RHOJO|nr:hypothetical protein SAMN04490220_0033 [Rhodococcus jostii]
MAQALGGLTDRPGRCVNERFKAAENLNGPFTWTAVPKCTE